VLDNDTAETLHARIQQAEWELYSPAVERVATGQIKITGRRCVAVTESTSPNVFVRVR
jgi:folate-dependent phosphoribosylglycinamide formyltransferase PurN